MKQPFIRRASIRRSTIRGFRHANREHGVTMVLVALAMVAIIAMAAISIDVITLYLAREEAQRSADTAALAAARLISLSGLTGDPGNTSGNWKAICGGASSPATQAATAVALQNVVGGAAANTVSVAYSAGGSAPQQDCSTLPTSPGGTFGINPTVTVVVQRTNLPNFFSRIWGRSGNSVSASATTEAFNPSYSGSVTGSIVPVQPSCVKPWIVPNHDPWNPTPMGTCDQGSSCLPLVNTTDGTITHPGISLNGTASQGVIGETFWLNADCADSGANCSLLAKPQANWVPGGPPPPPPNVEPPPSLHYLPGQVLYNGAAVPSCGSDSMYETNVAGCDQSTLYQCGVQSSLTASPNMVDLGENPAFSGDVTNGVSCLIHQSAPGDAADGQDTLNPYAAPSSYPFQILAGSSNPLVSTGLASGTPISSSPSVVSLPIYDDQQEKYVIGPGTTPVTIIGFLQVFIDAVDQYGNVKVTVLNVVGCSSGSGSATYPVSPSAVTGTSPVPTRIITPPTP